MRSLKIGLIGAGERGAQSYAPYALQNPQDLTITCVAEPIDERREAVMQAHQIPQAMCFTTWETMLAQKPELDAVIVATQDQDHYAPVMEALRLGYHVLCEKPMAETYEKSREMVEFAEQQGRLLMVCHVLRYTSFFCKLKEVMDSGVLGPIQAIHHIENVGYFHFAHSFVRGNWHKASDCTPMIVAKCCHDMDILNFLVGKECKRLSSFGSLQYFKKENAPEGAANRCVDCQYQKSCQFSAYEYVGGQEMPQGFRKVVSRAENLTEFMQSLEQSPYMQCVYQCDNDVADRQTVQMEYEDGMVVGFTVSAFSQEISRQTKIMGTLGEIEGKLEENCFYFREFATGNVTKYSVSTTAAQHAGGDEKIMAQFCHALRNPEARKAVSAKVSLMGHCMAFAAEESRLHGGKVIELDQYSEK